MARRKQAGLFEVLVELPWPFGLAFGVVGFFIIYQTLLRPLAWPILLLGLVTAALSAFGARQRRRLLDAQTGLDSLRAMSWQKFELLVGEAYRRLGYRVLETGQGGADGGIDLQLSKDNSITLVQCKQWRTQRIGVTVVREMFGLMVHHRSGAVKIVSTGTFTPEAVSFAAGKPIELVDGDDLLRLVEGVRAEARVPSDTNAASERPFRENEPSMVVSAPHCPECRSPMVKRINRRTSVPFWGCTQFPKCRGSIAIGP